MAQASTTALVVIAVLFVFPSMILAKQYVVGDDLGWDGTADYQAWADGKSFQEAGNHDVAQAASAEDFDNCASSPDMGTYNSGNDALALNVAGTYYFLYDYHCDVAQQKFMVTVS
ncbi:PREDICTED: mavicyanin-like [Fragaria vesca subsp. vesca]|uniref:mavicyanin-like n=1 Tax=Fragaria vesca subsp. vesca TaxID=101020 RepID=UPI0002C34631|nr:PREDICTED: mavicyanin-like [Fragaria vesca subsp. vesca]